MSFWFPFLLGVASVLSAEFFLAHWFIYRSSRATQAQAAVADVLPEVDQAKGFIVKVEEDADRTKKFFHDLFSSPPANTSSSVPLKGL